MAKFIYASAVISCITYILLLSSVLNIMLVFSSDKLMNTLLMSILVVLSFMISLIGIRESWYELATAYTPHEEFLCRVKRVFAFSVFGLSILNMILLLMYLLTLLSYGYY